VPLILSNHGIRKLTPRETFNIQGFPSDYILPNDVADGQLYKQAGNSVAIPVIARIAEEILKSLKSAEHKNIVLSDKRFTLIYTKMVSNNSGESYVVKTFDTEAELDRFTNEYMIQIISEKEY